MSSSGDLITITPLKTKSPRQSEKTVRDEFIRVTTLFYA